MYVHIYIITHTHEHATNNQPSRSICADCVEKSPSSSFEVWPPGLSPFWSLWLSLFCPSLSSPFSLSSPCPFYFCLCFSNDLSLLSHPPLSLALLRAPEWTSGANSRMLILEIAHEPSGIQKKRGGETWCLETNSSTWNFTDRHSLQMKSVDTKKRNNFFGHLRALGISFDSVFLNFQASHQLLQQRYWLPAEVHSWASLWVDMGGHLWAAPLQTSLFAASAFFLASWSTQHSVAMLRGQHMGQFMRHAALYEIKKQPLILNY